MFGGDRELYNVVRFDFFDIQSKLPDQRIARCLFAFEVAERNHRLSQAKWDGRARKMADRDSISSRVDDDLAKQRKWTWYRVDGNLTACYLKHDEQDFDIWRSGEEHLNYSQQQASFAQERSSFLEEVGRTSSNATFHHLFPAGFKSSLFEKTTGSSTDYNIRRDRFSGPPASWEKGVYPQAAPPPTDCWKDRGNLEADVFTVCDNPEGLEKQADVVQIPKWLLRTYLQKSAVRTVIEGTNLARAAFTTKSRKATKLKSTDDDSSNDNSAGLLTGIGIDTLRKVLNWLEIITIFIVIVQTILRLITVTT